MSTNLNLKIVTGPHQGKQFVFDEHDIFLFGRMDDCHVCLPDDHLVSRHHFILEVNPPDARLRDLGSLNGTYVNEKKFGGREAHQTPEEGAQRRYPEVDLHDGDQIGVGNTLFHLIVENPAEPPPQPVHCQKCGKDASAEVGSTRFGDYLCVSCRNIAQNDPAALLAALLAQAGRPDVANMDFPDYEMERKLGEGGMGAVHLVRHKQKGFRAALKVMLAKVAVDEHSRRQFLREVEVSRSLRHKHIVEFIDYGSAGSMFYIVLEYCAGGSLADLMLRRGGRLPLADAGPIMLQALDGLAFAHAQGFVHRDLKPQNILLAGQEYNWTAKVADMGLSKNFAQAGFSGMTVTGSFGGSFPFMPREQVTNFKYVKPVSDVWSMGATFYYILTGQFPRDFPRGQDPLDVILKGVLVPVRKRDSRLPSRVAEVIDRSLTNNHAERYHNAAEMREALELVV
jgi:hypothetical protein